MQRYRQQHEAQRHRHPAQRAALNETLHVPAARLHHQSHVAKHNQSHTQQCHTRHAGDTPVQFTGRKAKYGA
ncbi:hypothetical protein [Serratia fonticola]|uniref:hypothetical protein n=1 Tax=Serratia fonticola TaxID=47917 RepID=UPI0021B813F4|nr:hypothetical protein [Serratia fonticola]